MGLWVFDSYVPQSIWTLLMYVSQLTLSLISSYHWFNRLKEQFKSRDVLGWTGPGSRDSRQIDPTNPPFVSKSVATKSNRCFEVAWNPFLFLSLSWSHVAINLSTSGFKLNPWSETHKPDGNSQLKQTVTALATDRKKEIKKTSEWCSLSRILMSVCIIAF